MRVLPALLLLLVILSPSLLVVSHASMPKASMRWMDVFNLESGEVDGVFNVSDKIYALVSAEDKYGQSISYLVVLDDESGNLLGSSLVHGYIEGSDGATYMATYTPIYPIYTSSVRDSKGNIYLIIVGWSSNGGSSSEPIALESYSGKSSLSGGDYNDYYTAVCKVSQTLQPDWCKYFYGYFDNVEIDDNNIYLYGLSGLVIFPLDNINKYYTLGFRDSDAYYTKYGNRVILVVHSFSNIFLIDMELISENKTVKGNIYQLSIDGVEPEYDEVMSIQSVVYNNSLYITLTHNTATYLLEVNLEDMTGKGVKIDVPNHYTSSALVENSPIPIIEVGVERWFGIMDSYIFATISDDLELSNIVNITDPLSFLYGKVIGNKMYIYGLTLSDELSISDKNDLRITRVNVSLTKKHFNINRELYELPTNDFTLNLMSGHIQLKKHEHSTAQFQGYDLPYPLITQIQYDPLQELTVHGEVDVNLGGNVKNVDQSIVLIILVTSLLSVVLIRRVVG